VRQGDADRALSVGLLIDEILATEGLDAARLRLIRALEPLAQGRQSKFDSLGVGLRASMCDWAINSAQRNDAVAIAAAMLVELEKTDQSTNPAAVARILTGCAWVFSQTGYLYAAVLLYCRACALLIGEKPALEPLRAETFHLAQCFGYLHDAFANTARWDEAWQAAGQQFLVWCAALGGDRLSYEPFVRFGQILVRRRSWDQAESFFARFRDTVTLSDQMLAAYYECHGDLAAWRKRFDQAAQLCVRALKLYQQQRERRSEIACFRHMGAICTQIGHASEARSWLRAALELAWQRADADWAAAVLGLLGNAETRVAEAIKYSGHLEEFRPMLEEIQSYHFEQAAKLRGLKEYCAQADQWVRRAVGLAGDVSPGVLPPDFSAAKEILRYSGVKLEASGNGASKTPSDDEVLLSRLTPSDPQAPKTFAVSMLVLASWLNPSAAGFG
jgi:tetratricopeptide (TPR) repeat protein